MTTSAVAVRAGLPVGVAADVAPGHVAIGGLHGLVTGNRPEIYYTVGKRAMQVQSFAVAFAGLGALSFDVTLGAHLRRRGATRGLVSALTAGATMPAVGLTGLAGATLALTDHSSKMRADVAATPSWINEDLLWITVFGGIAVIAVSVGGGILRSGAFPRWVGWIALAIGVAALTGALSWFAFMATWLLTLGLAITLLVRGADHEGAGRLAGARLPALVTTSSEGRRKVHRTQLALT